MGPVAVAHNGNLINAALLRQQYEEHGHIFQSTTDTEIIVHLLAKPTHVEKHDPLPHVLKHLQGAFSLLFLFPDRIEAVPRPVGHPPAGAGQDGGRALVRGERDVRVRRDRRRVRPRDRAGRDRPHRRPRPAQPPLRRRRPPEQAHCVFEHVYFANPASKIFGQNVHTRPRGDGPAARPRGAGRGRLRHADARLRPQRGAGLRARSRGSRSRKGSSPTASSAARSSCPARPPARPGGGDEAEHHPRRGRRASGS